MTCQSLFSGKNLKKRKNTLSAKLFTQHAIASFNPDKVDQVAGKTEKEAKEMIDKSKDLEKEQSSIEMDAQNR